MYTSLLQKIIELTIVMSDEHAAGQFLITVLVSPAFSVNCCQLVPLDWIIHHSSYKVQNMFNSFRMGRKDAVVARNKNACEGLPIVPHHFQRIAACKFSSH